MGSLQKAFLLSGLGWVLGFRGQSSCSNAFYMIFLVFQIEWRAIFWISGSSMRSAYR
jgi:hypothetical protein